MAKIYLLTASKPRTDEGKLKYSSGLIWEALDDEAKGAFFSPDEVDIVFTDDSLKLFVGGEELEPGILLIRSARNEEERIYEIANCFESIGGAVIDPPESLIYPVGKLLPFIYRQGGVKLPKTIFFTKTNVENGRYETLTKNLGFPFIVKPQNGFGGAGVALIHSSEELKSYLDSSGGDSLMAQEYIADIVDEFRVVVIGGKALGAARKLSDNLAKNAALGGAFEQVDDKEVLDFAEKAAKLEKADILGTDIARTSDGSLWLIENNRDPNFIAFRKATGILVEEHILDFALKGS